MPYTKIALLNYSQASPIPNSLGPKMTSMVEAGKTDGEQYSKVPLQGVRLFTDSAAAQEWIDFIESTSLGDYLISSTVSDYVQPTFTKKTLTNVSGAPFDPTLATQINTMILEGKTDGVRYNNLGTPSGIRIWSDAAAANEWIAALENSAVGEYITSTSVVDNDILPLTLSFSEFDQDDLEGGGAIQDDSGTFDVLNQSFTLNNGATNGSGVRMTNLTPSNDTIFTECPANDGRLWSATWAAGSTYAMTRVAMYSFNGSPTFWILDPSDWTYMTPINSGTFKYPVTLKPLQRETTFDNGNINNGSKGW